MKQKMVLRLFIPALIIVSMAGCKKNYILGGKVNDVNAFKNMSTYDFLHSNPMYDTLVQLIDVAGIKDKINKQATTFFAPSDNSILIYLNVRTILLQNIDPDLKFPLDSLKYYLQNNINGTADSLLMYIVDQPLTYDMLSNTGKAYPTELAGDTVVVSYEFTKEGTLGYSSVVSSTPQLVYFTQLWYPYPLDASHTAGSIPLEIGIRTRVKTSNITTQNGVVEALENFHTLFFAGTKQ